MRALLIIPTYNSGKLLSRTVKEALKHVAPVWVVVDGSTDGSDLELEAAIGENPSLRILHMDRNRGKGAAVIHGCKLAHAAGYTHACVMDADGQHKAADIPRFLDCARQMPDAVVMGVPIFGPEAPAERVKGRRVGNTFAKIETLWSGPDDSLFGFRVYPIAPLLDVMRHTFGGRRYDFDTEAAVRLMWAGLRPVNLPSPVRYPRAEDGGISHFKYLRDNVLLTSMHTRLLLELLFRWPFFLIKRRRWKDVRQSAATTQQQKEAQ